MMWKGGFTEEESLDVVRALSEAGIDMIEISGGTYEDLVWAKASDASGVETAVPTARNPNFGRPVSRYAPTSARLGFRIRF